ncbi:MAG: peptidase M28 family protein, partial [Verrucomicrobiales bacterium]|nr:peptidase M28 family protein [Verrucomicrobiales bacterium]
MFGSRTGWRRSMAVAALGVIALGLSLATAAEGPAPGWWNQEIATRLEQRATAGTNAYWRLVRWCDDFGPRFSGTEALERSLDWVMEELRRDGFEGVRGEEVQVPRWVRGMERVEQLAPAREIIPVLGLGGTTSTPAGGIEARVLVVTNFAELTARAAEARGRIVVFNPAFTSYGDIVRFRFQGAVEAAKVGAVASLVRSVTPFSLRTPHTGGMAYQEGVRRIPHAAVPTEDAERWSRWQQRGVDVTVRV